MTKSAKWRLGLALAGSLLAFMPSQAAMQPGAGSSIDPNAVFTSEAFAIAAGRRGGVRPVARRNAIATQQRANRRRPNARPPIVRRAVVVVRPWRPRPHYGRVVAGIVLGTVIGVAIANAAPAPPAPDLCWYWTNSVATEGYWDYCR